MDAKKEVSIDETKKEELLNTKSPSINKGGLDVSDTVPKTPKSKKPKGTIELTDAERDDDSPIVEEEFPSTERELGTFKEGIGFEEREDKSAFKGDSEIDFELEPEEFKNKFLDAPNEGRDAFNNQTFTGLNNINFGKGVEDYRDYIDNPIQGKYLNINRALNQDNSEQFGNAVKRVVANILPEIVTQAANTVEGIGNIITQRDDFGNPVSKKLGEFQDWVIEQNPIYAENPNKALDVEDFAWWADRGSSLATSIGAFVALGYATGGLSAGTRVTSALAKTGKAKGLTRFLQGNIGGAADDLAKFASNGKAGFNPASFIDTATTSFLMTTAESVGTATEVYHNSFKAKKQELLDSGSTEEQAEKEARDFSIVAADRAFEFNQMNILLNLTSVAPFIKKSKLASSGAIRKRTLTGGASKIAGEAGQEYLEESINFLSEKFAVDKDYDFTKAMKDLSTREGLEAGLLGALGGVGQTSFSLSGQYIPFKKNNEGERISDYSQYKKDLAIQEEIKTKFDSYGDAHKDDLLDIFTSLGDQINNSQAVKKANEEGNTKEAERLQEKVFVGQAYKAFTAGLGDSFKSSLERIKSLSDEQAEALGYDISEENNYRTIIDKKIQDLNELENVYNKTRELYKSNEAYSAASNAYYLKELKDKNTKDINQSIENLKPVFDNLIKQSGNTFNFNQETGNYEFDTLSVFEANTKEIKENLEKNKDKKEKLSNSLAKDKDRLIAAKKNTEADNTNQIKALEETINNTEKALKETNLEEISLNEKFKQEENYINNVQKDLSILTSDLENNQEFQKLRSLINVNKSYQEGIDVNEKAFAEVISLEGQKLAQKEVEEGQTLLEEERVKNKVKSKQTVQQAKKEQESNEQQKVEIDTSNVDSTSITKTITETPTVPSTEVGEDFDILEEFILNGDTTASEISQETEITNTDILKDLSKILNDTKSVEIKQSLVQGIVKKYYEDNPLDTDASHLEDLYNKIATINNENNLNINQLLNSSNNTLAAVNDFLDDNASTNLAREIDSTFNLDDDGKGSFVEEIEQSGKETIDKFDGLISKLLEKNNLNINDSFDKIVKTLNKELGPELTQKIYYKLQGFIGYKTGRRLNKYYSTIVKNSKEAQQEKDLQEKINNSTRIEDFKEPSLKDISNANKLSVRADLLLDGEVLEDIFFEGDIDNNGNKTQFTSAKSRGSNKIAFKTLGSKRILIGNDLVDQVSTDEVNLDLDKKLLKGEVKTGDTITFELEADFTDKNGTRFETVEEDGEVFTYEHTLNIPQPIKHTASEKAAIRIKLNGELLEDAYLHLPSFINEGNITERSDLNIELDNLRLLRKSVIAGNNPSATVSTVSQGNLITTPSNKLTSVNLPKVEVGIVSKGIVNTTNGQPINSNANTSHLIDGIPVALIPKGDTVVPINLFKNELNRGQIDVVAELIKLKFYNEKDLKESDYTNIELLLKKGIDIRSNSKEANESLRNILRDYIQLKTFNGKISIEQEILKYDYPVFFLQANDNTYTFKAGDKNVNALELINNNGIKNSKADIDESISILKQVLENAKVNFNQGNLQATNFSPFTNIEGGILKAETFNSYGDFIKENSQTNFKSIDVDGDPIYTVQKSVYFDLDTPLVNSNLETNNEEDILDDIDLDDFDFNLDAEIKEIDSKELPESTKTYLRENTELAESVITNFSKEYLIKNIPTLFQEKFVNSLVSIAVGKVENSTVSISNVNSEFLEIINGYKKTIPARKLQAEKILNVLKSLKGNVQELSKKSPKIRGSELETNLINSSNPIKYLEDSIKNADFYSDLIDSAIENVEVLSKFAVAKLKSYNNISTKENKIDNEDIQPDGGNVRTSFDSDYYLSLNGSDQLSAKVKNIFIGITDAKYLGKNSIGEDVISSEKFLDLDVVVPFDRLYTEVQGIIAQASDNYRNQVSQENNEFDAYIEHLQFHVVSKPYLVNLINKLKTLDIDLRNSFVTNMSKAKVNHITTYTSEFSTRDSEGGNEVQKVSMVNKPTNSNESSKLLINKWANTFYSSNGVFVSEVGEVTVTKEKINEIKEVSESIKETVISYKNSQYAKILKELGNNSIASEEKARLLSTVPDDIIIDNIRQSFASIGFEFSKDFLNHFYNNKYSNGNVSITDFHTNPSGFIGALLGNFNSNQDVFTFNKETNDIFNDGFIKTFGRYVSSFETSLYAASYSNGEGKNIYGYSLPKFMTDRVNELKTNPEFVKELLEDTFQGSSIVLDHIFNKETGEYNYNKVYDLFNYFTFDSNVTTKFGFNPKTLNKMSSAGYEQVALSLFYNKGVNSKNSLYNLEVNGVVKPIKYRYGKFFAPTFSDKKTAMGLSNLIYEVNGLQEDGKLEEGNPIYDLVLQETVLPEYNRIKQEQNNPNSVNIKNYKEASSLFYFMPELNDLQELREEDGITLRDLDIDVNAKLALRQAVIEHIENLKNNKLDFWKDNGIIKSNGVLKFVDNTYVKQGYDTNPNRLAYEYVSNYLISNATYFKLFAGDPALYYKKGKDANSTIKKTFDNIGKRLAAQIAPGTDVISKPNEQTKVAILSDAEDVGKIKGLSTSSSINYLRSIIGDSANLYANGMAGTDAMAYSTMKEWATVEFKRGNITEKDFKKVIEIENKKEISDSELEFLNSTFSNYLLNSNKPVFVSNHNEGKYRRTFYAKPSVLPLSSHLTKGLELDKLRKAMVRDGVDTVFFATAVKVGQPSKNLNIFNTDGSIKEDLAFVDNEGGNLTHTLNIPRKAHKIQLDNPINKKDITDGSQQRKLLFADILDVNDFVHPRTGKKVTGNELRKEFNENYVEIFKNRRLDLLEELNYNEDSGKFDLNVLQKVLKKEFEERGFPLSDLSYLNIIDNGKGGFDFNMPLWTSTLSSKIESLLVSLIDNRIRTVKSAGNSFILGSNAGFKPQLKEGKIAKDFIENTKGIVFDKEWIERGDFELRGQTVIEGVTQPAEIMIASKFRTEPTATNPKGDLIDLKEFVDENGFIDSNKVPSEILKMFGYRIPTQGLNSMAYMKVVGFLPSQYSEMLLAPSEFTTQMGSDFDIDKLYANSYSTVYKDGKLLRVDSPDIDNGEYTEQKEMNDILDIKLAIISNPNPAVQSKIVKPLDINVFEDYSKIIDAAYDDGTDFYSPISQDAFKTKYLSGVNGSGAIGVFANASTLHANLQNVDKDRFHITRTIKGDTKKHNIKIGGTSSSYNNSNSLSDTKVLGREDGELMTKTEVISNLVTTAVDNENIQVLGKINFNDQTYNFIVGAIMAGYDPEFITYFVNQPIIKDYIKLGGKVNDSSILYNDAQRFKDLESKYKGYLEIKKNAFGKDYASYIDFNANDGAIYKDKNSPFRFTKSDLLKNIQERRTDEQLKENPKDFYNLQQVAILYKFTSLQKTFENIKTLQDALNLDGSNGIGSSIMYALNKETQIQNLDSINISNVYDLLGDVKKIDLNDKDIYNYLKEEGYEDFKKLTDGELLLKPETIIGGMYQYALKPINELFTQNSMFPYEADILNKLSTVAYDHLKGNRELGSFNQEIDLKKKSLNYVKQFLFSDLFSDLFVENNSKERERLLVDSPTNKSLATKLIQAKLDFPGKFKNNPLLNSLVLEKGTDYQLSKVEFNATNDTTSLNFLSSSLYNLLQDNSEYYNDGKDVLRGKDIALDLVRHQYISGGIQFRKQFIKYIPLEIFEAFGINDKIRNLDLNNFDSVDFAEKNRRFKIQFLQHFPEFISSTLKSDGLDIKTNTLITELDEGDLASDISKIEIEGDIYIAKLLGQDGSIAEYRIINKAGDVANNVFEFDSSVEYITSIIKFNDKTVELEDNRVKWNEARLNEITKTPAYFLARPNETANYIPYKTNLEIYDNSVKVYGKNNVILISKKLEDGTIELHNTSRFKGIVTLNDPSIKPVGLEEEVDFIRTVSEKALELEKKDKTPVQIFKDTMGIVDGNTEESLRSIIKVLKGNNNDVSRAYMYDLLEESLSNLMIENPNLKLKFSTSGANGVTTSYAGEIKSIILNVNGLNNLEITEANSKYNTLHKTVIEELLHSITKSAVNNDSVIRKQLGDIRTDLIEDLKENNPTGYADYLEVKNATSKLYYIQKVVRPDLDAATLLTNLENSKNDPDFDEAIYKEVKDALSKNGLSVSAFKDRIFNKYLPSNKARANYYPLVNLDEFIAGVFLNDNIQKSLNKVKSKDNKTLLEKFIAKVIQALNRMSDLFTNNGKSKVWEKLFKEGINKDTLLEDAVVKSIVLIKNFNSKKLNKNEKKLIIKELNSAKMSVKNINQGFGLTFNGEQQYIENASELADVLRKSFSNIDVITYKKNYIVVQDKNRLEDIKLSELVLADINDGGINTDSSTDVSFNLDNASKEEKQENRKNRLLALRKTRIKKLTETANIAKAAGDNARFRFLSHIADDVSSTENLELIESLDSFDTLAQIGTNDLKEVKTILNNDTLTFSEIVYVKQILSNWNNVLKLYFTEEEQKYNILSVDKFTPIINDASTLTKTMNKKLIGLYEQAYKEENGKDVNFEEEFKNFADVNVFDREGADISRVDNKLFDFVHQQNLAAFNQTKRETFDTVEKLEVLLKDALPEFKKLGNKKNGAFNVMLQKYDDGTLTGDIVSPFNKEFVNSLKYQFSTLNVEDSKARFEASTKLNQWLKENTVYFNPQLLYREDSNKEEKENHIKELKTLLGEDLYNFFEAKQKNLNDAYQLDKQSKFRDLLIQNNISFNEEDLSNFNVDALKLVPSAYNEWGIWLAENSPYIHYEQVINGKVKEVNIVNEDGTTSKKKVWNRGFEYTVNVPKEQQFDKDFKTILNNPKLLAFYNTYTETFNDLKKYLPPSAQEAIRFNGLPELEKTFYENLSQSGNSKTFKTIYDNFNKSIRTEDLSTTSFTDIDKTTGEENRFLNFNLFNNNSKEYKTYLNRRLMEFSADNDGFAAPPSFIAQVKKEFNNLVAERKSKDLGKILKAYAGLALTYKHKSRIQDTVIAAEFVLNDLPEYKRNAAKEFVKDRFGDWAYSPNSTAFSNTKQMFRHYLENFFDKPYKTEGITSKRILTTEEKKSKDIYQKTIDANKIELDNLVKNPIKNGDIRIKFLEEQIEQTQELINNLGGDVTISKVADKALKVFQLKGMGWNLLAGIGNLGYGVVGNLIESNDSRLISKKEMLDAMSLTMNSVGRNLSFNKWNGVDGVALKIRNLMERNDILKEASHELYANSVKGSLGTKLRFLSPYNLQKRTEYMNQAPIMIAYYKKTKFEHNGEQVSLWDAYGKDAKWDSKYGEEQDELINKVNSKITQYIKRVHGNYDPSSPMKIKSTIGGRAIAQFRSWLVESVKQRWEVEKYDSILEVEFKGRYRSVGTYAKQFGKIGAATDLLKGVLLNIVGKKVDFTKEGLNEVDAVNMRKMVSEITMWLGMYATYLSLTFLFRDEDEPEKDQEALNITLNMINRIKSEMTIYINPIEAYNIAKNPAPAMGLVGDVLDIVGSAKDVINGEDEIKNGAYAGESKAFRSFKGAIPLLSSIKAFEDNASKEYK